MRGNQVAVLDDAVSRGETGGPSTGVNARLAARSWTTAACEDAAMGRGDPVDVTRLVDVALGLGGDDAEAMRAAVTSGRVGLRAARVCLSEMARLKPLLVDGAAPAVWQGYAALAESAPLRVLHSLRPAMLARYGRGDVLERELASASTHADLSAGVRDGALVKYRLTLGLEAHAVLEAALGPLSAPRPEPDGAPDERPAGRRRAEALMDLIDRSVGGAGSKPGSGRARILVTTTFEDLLRSAGAVPRHRGQPSGTGGQADEAGTSTLAERSAPDSSQSPPGPSAAEAPTSPTAEVLATTASGTLLPGSVLGRLACDGSVRGVVFGTDGEILHLGTEVRLFTGAQRLALSLRDRGCTFPGCDIPADWTRAHHLVHWLHGGTTTLANGALLCSRHHAVVHRHRLRGHLDPSTNDIVWDLTPGSYDAQGRAGP